MFAQARFQFGHFFRRNCINRNKIYSYIKAYIYQRSKFPPPPGKKVAQNTLILINAEAPATRFLKSNLILATFPYFEVFFSNFLAWGNICLTLMVGLNMKCTDILQRCTKTWNRGLHSSRLNLISSLSKQYIFMQILLMECYNSIYLNLFSLLPLTSPFLHLIPSPTTSLIMKT